MTISGSGMNVNFNQTPTIFEKETSGARTMQNESSIGRGNVVISPQTDTIPFTQMNDRNVWNYKSEPDRPTLTPNTLLRGAGPDKQSQTTDSKTGYGETLFNQLPDEVKAEMEGIATIYTPGLKAVIQAASKFLEGIDRGKALSDSENAKATAEINTHFPNKAFQTSAKQTEELGESTQKWINAMGKNEPEYLDSSDYIGNVQNLLKETVHESET